MSIHGTLITASPAVHHQVVAGEALPAEITEGSVLFHCRPNLVRKGRKWAVAALEPEVSLPFESSIPECLSNRLFRGFLGYGGFSDQAFAHFRRFTGCFLQTFAGTGPALASYVQSVTEVPFGSGLKGPDAMWALDVAGLPAIVTMDLQGRSLHQLIAEGSGRRLTSMIDGTPTRV